MTTLALDTLALLGLLLFGGLFGVEDFARTALIWFATLFSVVLPSSDGLNDIFNPAPWIGDLGVF